MLGGAWRRPPSSLPSSLSAQVAARQPAAFLDAMIGVLIAPPGQMSGGALLVDLLPGRTYAIVCQFRDGEGQPPHLMLGMHKSLVVR